jgi:PPP family 3-phenylpropionic acid transporter
MWILFLFTALTGGFAMSSYSNYFLPYMKEMGASESTMGLALSLGTVCEVPVLFFGNRLLGYFKPFRLFLLTLLIMGLRLILFSVANTASQALLIQTINGLTFPAMWMAGVAFVGEHAPPGLSATAQGILSAIVFGVGTSLGGFLGGNLLGIVGAKEMYLIFGIITTLIVASISLLAKQHPELFLS